MQSRTPLLLVIMTAVAAVLMMGLVACGGSAGAAAPPLQGKTMQGKPFDLAKSGGKPTVVNFFASWCPSCVAETADLVAFADAHPEVPVIGVAINDALEDTQRFAVDYRVPYTIVMDPDSKAAADWGVSAIPATFFVDSDGAIQASIVGPATQEQFEEKLQSVQ